MSLVKEKTRTLFLKHLAHPDEVRQLPKTKIEIVNLDNGTVMRGTFEPGWKWSECVKPTAGTESCEVAHFNYVISGQMKITMDDGSSKLMQAGDVAIIPPGHNGEVIGDEPCIILDFSGGDTYGKRA